MMHIIDESGCHGARIRDGIQVAIVYHSGYGHTARQAVAVAEGVRTAGSSALLLSVEEAPQRWDDLHTAHAIIFGAPAYMGAASASFKAFQEATSTVMLAGGYRWKDKIAAGFTNSGAQAGDKLSTLLQISRKWQTPSTGSLPHAVNSPAGRGLVFGRSARALP